MGEKPDLFGSYFNDVFTVPASLAGLPAVSVPSGLSQSRLPMALQIIGNYYDESGMLNLAAVIHKNSAGLFL